MNFNFPNGAGYHDYDDVPETTYEKEEDTTNINDDILLESEVVE